MIADEETTETGGELDGLEEGWDTPAVSPAAAPDGSLVGMLIDQARRIEQETTTVIEVPGYDGKLGLRVKYVQEDEFQKMQRKASDNPSKNYALTMNLLIRGTVEVVARRDSGADWEPLVDGEVSQLDERLAERLRLGPVRSKRQVLEALVKVNRIPRISTMLSEYVEWVQGETPGVSERLGES